MPFAARFDWRLKLEFHGSRITSDAGFLTYRELDEALGLIGLGGAALSDPQRGKNRRHLLTGLLRQSVFGRLAGDEAKLLGEVTRRGGGLSLLLLLQYSLYDREHDLRTGAIQGETRRRGRR